MSDPGFKQKASQARLTATDLEQTGLSASEALAILPRILALLEADDPREAWRGLVREVLRPEQPFALHKLLFETAYAAWDLQRGPAPAWLPDPEEARHTNVGRLLSELAGDWAAVHRWTVDAPEAFWSRMLTELGIVVRTPARTVLDLGSGPEAARWFPGMRLNIAESCFRGRDPQAVAVRWQAEGGPLQTLTVAELEAQARRVACALDHAGFAPGDAIAIAMPMNVESIAIYLGIVLMGGVVVSIADSFSAEEMATRLRIARARGIFTQDVIARGGRRLPLFERVAAANAPRAIVLSAARTAAPDAALRPGDQTWSDFLVTAGDTADFEPHITTADHPTNILFSSGTTGEPKAIPWTHLTPIKAAADGWAHHDIRAGDVVAWPTNLGWMMGPWLIYASLLNNATIALYDGSPLGREFCRFVQDAGVTMLGVVPSLVKAWRAHDTIAGLDWSRIRRFSSTGEASAFEDYLWLMSRAGYRPVIEYCGGTEIGGGYITGTMVQPQAPATFSTPAVGSDFVILDEQGRPAPDGVPGELALIPPMLGSSSRLLNRDHHEVYFAGMPTGPDGQTLRRHGDQMVRLPGGYFRALGRVDDTMNLGGIKVSAAEIERVCNRVDGIHETAAIGVPPAGGGPDRLVLFAVLKPGWMPSRTELRSRFQSAIRSGLNPLFKVSDVRIVDALPRTASNKVMRRVLRDRYDG